MSWKNGIFLSTPALVQMSQQPQLYKAADNFDLNLIMQQLNASFHMEAPLW